VTTIGTDLSSLEETRDCLAVAFPDILDRIGYELIRLTDVITVTAGPDRQAEALAPSRAGRLTHRVRPMSYRGFAFRFQVRSSLVEAPAG
jgi:hypothetical protein